MTAANRVDTERSWKDKGEQVIDSPCHFGACIPLETTDI